MSVRIAQGAAFVIGFGLALAPTVGPFIAILVFISARLRAIGRDAIWLASAALLSMGPLLAGRIDMIAPVALQVLAGWLIYRAFGALRSISASHGPNRSIEWGMLTGLTLLVAVNVLTIEHWNLSTAKTIAQAIVWEGSPALFGHAVLTVGGLVAILSRTPMIRIAALSVAAIGILMSGSREAALGWLIVSIAVVLVQRGGRLLDRAIELALITLMSIVAAGFAPLLGWGNVGFLLQPTSVGESPNLLQGTELAHGDWWDTSWVSVDASTVNLSGRTLTSYSVTNEGDEGWLRLQQVVELQPATSYTVSAWILYDGGTRVPGLQGWGQIRAEGDLSTFAVLGELRNGWNARITGPGLVVDSGIANVSGDWRRVFVTFTYEGEEPLDWFVGLAPDANGSQGATTTFAGFQVERGVLSEYRPGEATRGLPLGAARTPVWRAAWQGIQQSPLLGQGDGSFTAHFLDLWPDRSRVHVVPAHAHNAFLSIWLERGLIGLLGLLLLLGAIAGPAITRGDIPLLAVILAIVVANLFDTTLLYGGVFYPLVAIAGWRAKARADEGARRDDLTRQASTRLALATADVLAALTSFAAALATATILAPTLGLDFHRPVIPSVVMYALLLWPALSWREGLYPGYGLTASQELKRQATICAYAGLLTTSAFAFLAPSIDPSVVVFGLGVAFSFFALPIGRAVTKRLLLHMDLWGRPVVILGAGDTGQRVARALQRSPLDGLHPVAFFDDDAKLVGERVGGLPVRGSLADAERFAAREDIMHAIVALPSLETKHVAHVIDQGKMQFRTVQYIPYLGGIPADNVGAASLDGMLAIEIRNNLAVRRNRVAKRAIDLVCATLGGLLISPVVLTIAIAIKLDSKGPVFFGHRRVGEDGRRFRTWKFRTMVKDAETALAKQLDQHAELRREWDATQKLVLDPRVTRVGRFLRRTSLDELPQLMNVFLGQMSLVGPRPIVEAEIEKYEDAFGLYKSVKPGITGQWQVSGRSDTSYSERVELDTYYVRNWSIWLDIVILIRTFRVVFKGSGAY